MEYGYICFAYSKNEWIAKAIAWFTKSKWSHTFITIPPILGNEMALEAASVGTCPVLFDKGYRNNPDQIYEVYRVKIPQEKIDNAIVASLGRLQTPYGYLEYPWFVWRYINAWLGRDIRSQDNWSKRNLVCAGLSDFFLDDCGLSSLSDSYGYNSISAQDIYEIVKAHPELFELVEKKD